MNHRSDNDMLFEDNVFVGAIRGAMADGEVQSAVGGKEIFRGNTVCATRAECGLPAYPKLP